MWHYNNNNNNRYPQRHRRLIISVFRRFFSLIYHFIWYSIITLVVRVDLWKGTSARNNYYVMAVVCLPIVRVHTNIHIILLYTSNVVYSSIGIQTHMWVSHTYTRARRKSLFAHPPKKKKEKKTEVVKRTLIVSNRFSLQYIFYIYIHACYASQLLLLLLISL